MNVMTIEFKQVLGFTSTELTSELRKAYTLRGQIIQRAAKNGKINLILGNVGRNAKICVVDYGGLANPFLAEVIFASETPLGGLGKRPSPWEIMIFEQKEADKQAAIIQIAKHLPAFFRSFYPEEANQAPIDIYDRGKSFIEKKPPIARVRFRGSFNLVTVSLVTVSGPKLKAA